MSLLKVLDKKGRVKGEVNLSDALTELEIRPWVLHRAVVTEEANRRQGTHAVKNRATVRGGGRKPWRQKKTGRARQGSIRAPHWRHGAVAHGPRPRDYEKHLNKRERRLAMKMAFASRVKAGDVVVLDGLKFDKPKTKAALEILQNLSLADARVLVILPEIDEVVLRSFRNLPNVEVRTAPWRGKEKVQTQPFSARDLLVAEKVLIEKEALRRIEEVWSEI